MAKITLRTASSGYQTTADLNQNFSDISSEFQNKVLYRVNPAGEPNQMENDLDMNSYKILNVKDASTSSGAVNYKQLQQTIAGASSGLIVRLRESRKTATDQQQVFNFVDIKYKPSANNLQVFVNDKAKVVDIDYKETSTTSIEFISGLNAGDTVDAYSNEYTTNSVTDAQAVSYTTGGSTESVKKFLDTIGPLRADLASTDPSKGAALVGNAVQIVNDISALRTVAVTTSRNIRTKGSARTGEGGGEFYGVTGAAVGTYVDDGGAVIVPTGGDGSAAWLRQVTGSATIEEYGGGVNATAAQNDAALSAIFSAFKVAILPAGKINISTTLTVPRSCMLVGKGTEATTLNITTDSLAVMATAPSWVVGMSITTDYASHTNDLLQVGTTAGGGGNGTTLEKLIVNGAGGSGIAVIDGNLGTIRDIQAAFNGRDGIFFGADTTDNNAWKLEGVIDVRSNTRDGLHFQGLSNGDIHNSNEHSANFIISQQNGRYGIYVNTRSSNITAYCEANTTADCYLDAASDGNYINLVLGAVTDNGTGNMVISRHGATYNRGFSGKVLLDGLPGAGIRLDNNDPNPGTLDITKTGSGAYSMTCNGYDATQTLTIEHGNTSLPFNLAMRGTVYPKIDNNYALGSGSQRWATVYAATGAINTSDAREKTPVSKLTDNEIAAANDLANEIGTYQWLAAIKEKGDGARTHIGMTVQKAIEIMQQNQLDPMAYGFICYDKWPETVIQHPETVDQGGKVTKTAWKETVPAGDRYSFRMDELGLFIAAGFNARLSCLEGSKTKS